MRALNGGIVNLAFMRPGAYDRILTVFSPDGRLFQVEYAIETVNRGATILGIACSDGVVLGAEEKIESKLQDPDFTWKLHEVDEHLGAAIAGLRADARVLIDQVRVYAQSNRLMYDDPIDVEVIAKRIGDVKQFYIQHAGVRPFGVSIIFGGIDKNGNRLFVTDPSGSYRGYKAVAVGVGREKVEGILKVEYREEMRLDEAIRLARARKNGTNHKKLRMEKRVKHKLTSGDGDQMKIDEIKYGLSGVFIEGKITEKSEPRTVNTRYGRRSVADATLEDETGTIKLSLWEDQIDRVNIGNKVSISGAYVTEFRNELQLNIPRSGKLEIKTEKVAAKDSTLKF